MKGIDGMRIEQMTAYVKTAQSESLSAASRDMFMTPQTLSASIVSMEKELGVKLIVRSQKGIELTPEGTIFKEISLAVLREYNKGLELLNACKPKNDVEMFNLKISGNLVFQKVLLPRITTYFRQNHPNCNINTSTKTRGDICEEVRRGTEQEHDGVVGFFGKMSCNGEMFEVEKPDNDLEVYPALEGKLVACVSADSPLSKYKKLSLKTIATYPLILFNLEEQKDHERLFQGYGKTRVILETDSISAWLQALEENNAIALIQDNILKQRDLDLTSKHNVVSIEIAENVKCQVYLVTRKKPSHIENLLIEYIKHYS